jgi:hypothetical protein
MSLTPSSPTIYLLPAARCLLPVSPHFPAN